MFVLQKYRLIARGAIVILTLQLGILALSSLDYRQAEMADLVLPPRP